jgi:hypothetical protein
VETEREWTWWLRFTHELGDREKPGAEREAATVKFSKAVTMRGIKKVKSRMLFEKRKASSDGDIKRDRPHSRKRSFARMLAQVLVPSTRFFSWNSIQILRTHPRSQNFAERRLIKAGCVADVRPEDGGGLVS